MSAFNGGRAPGLKAKHFVRDRDMPVFDHLPRQIKRWAYNARFSYHPAGLANGWACAASLGWSMERYLDHLESVDREAWRRFEIVHYISAESLGL